MADDKRFMPGPRPDRSTLEELVEAAKARLENPPEGDRQGKPLSPRASILREAEQLVSATRRVEHGDPNETFAEIAAIWSVILGVEIRPDQHAACMIAVKLVRAKRNPAGRDNWLDMAGYAAIGGEVAPQKGNDPT